MNPTVTNITENQKDYINHQIARVDSMLYEFDGTALTGKLSDLSKLQALRDNNSSRQLSRSALSFAFTEIFLNANPEYRWVSVNRETSMLAVQYLTSKVVWYPESSFDNLQDSAKPMRSLYLDLLKHLRTLIIAEGFYAD